jgi:succinoglycan biosynthesis protein ExoV
MDGIYNGENGLFLSVRNSPGRDFMQVFCFTEGATTNFGDDLNRWLWPRLLPGLVGRDNFTLFCGIGTILGRGLPAARRHVVFSSGVGYGPPPEGFGGDDWDVVCVRGPLTARVLGLPSSKAVADGALLLGSLPEYQPLPESERAGTIFMPHYDVLGSGDWPEICRRAGVEFVSPHLPSEEVLQRIRSAKLVLADAMHAAIVADVFRVPWIPLMTSDRINTFKWLDWTLSLDLPYKPLPIPSPTILESVRNRTLGLRGHRYSLKDATEEAAMRDFMRSRKLKEHRLWEPYSYWARRLTHSVPQRILELPIFSAGLRDDTSKRLDRVAAAMRTAAQSASYLSEEKRFYGRVNELVEKLEEVKALPKRQD